MEPSAPEVYNSLLEGKESSVRVSIYGETKAGLRHGGINEDAFFMQTSGSFGIFDGVGGKEGGEIASRTAKETIEKRISLIPGNTSAEVAESQVVSAFSEANKAICLEKSGNPELKDMATTGVIVVLAEGGKKAVVAWVGDSRVYRLGRGIFTQVTEDDSIISGLVKMGKLSPEQEKKIDQLASTNDCQKLQESMPEISVRELFRKRNQITSSIGIESSMFVKHTIINLREGDRLIGVTDGICDNLLEVEIANIVTGNQDIKRAVLEMITKATSRSRETTFRSKDDDMTVVIAEMGKNAKAREIPEVPRTIAEAKNFAEFYAVLADKGHIQGTKKIYEVPEIIETIENVRIRRRDENGNIYGIRWITRSEGLREKVSELLVQNAANFSDLYRILGQLETVAGSQKSYAASELRQMIEDLRIGNPRTAIGEITNGGNLRLREKVRMLLGKEYSN